MKICNSRPPPIQIPRPPIPFKNPSSRTLIEPNPISILLLGQRKSEMSSSSSCSHWWHAPIYIAATAALILAAMSSSSSSLSPGTPQPQPAELVYPIDLFAPDLMHTLHRSGFHLSALLIQISAVHVSLPSSSTNLTFLAVPDGEIAGLPSLASAVRLFRLHVVPIRLDFPSLAGMPRGACIPTLLPGYHLRVTTPTSGPDRSVSIDGVQVTHPDLFLAGSHAVHGVASRLDYAVSRQDSQDSCHVAEEEHEATAETKIPWDRVVRSLSSGGGYDSFGIALGAVLDSLRGEIPFVTVFAPRDSGFGYVALAGGQLESVVRRHVAVGRYGYAQLTGVGSAGMEVGTMEEGKAARVTVGPAGEVEVGGVEVVEPEVYTEGNVVVHGIAGELTAD